ncbi:hypothetical protein B0H11DRAFT_1904519 [Mycena galericulata]|nr:hypothetical protein B0H11DRAFT_1904519 [Mycena galericulata]
MQSSRPVAVVLDFEKVHGTQATPSSVMSNARLAQDQLPVTEHLGTACGGVFFKFERGDTTDILAALTGPVLPPQKRALERGRGNLPPRSRRTIRGMKALGRGDACQDHFETCDFPPPLCSTSSGRRRRRVRASARSPAPTSRPPPRESSIAGSGANTLSPKAPLPDDTDAAYCVRNTWSNIRVARRLKGSIDPRFRFALCRGTDSSTPHFALGPALSSPIDFPPSTTPTPRTGATVTPGPTSASPTASRDPSIPETRFVLPRNASSTQQLGVGAPGREEGVGQREEWEKRRSEQRRQKRKRKGQRKRGGNEERGTKIVREGGRGCGWWRQRRPIAHASDARHAIPTTPIPGTHSIRTSCLAGPVTGHLRLAWIDQGDAIDAHPHTPTIAPCTHNAHPAAPTDRTRWTLTHMRTAAPARHPRPLILISHSHQGAHIHPGMLIDTTHPSTGQDRRAQEERGAPERDGESDGRRPRTKTGPHDSQSIAVAYIAPFHATSTPSRYPATATWLRIHTVAGSQAHHLQRSAHGHWVPHPPTRREAEMRKTKAPPHPSQSSLPATGWALRYACLDRWIIHPDGRGIRVTGRNGGGGAGKDWAEWERDMRRKRYEIAHISPRISLAGARRAITAHISLETSSPMRPASSTQRDAKKRTHIRVHKERSVSVRLRETKSSTNEAYPSVRYRKMVGDTGIVRSSLISGPPWSYSRRRRAILRAKQKDLADQNFLPVYLALFNQKSQRALSIMGDAIFFTVKARVFTFRCPQVSLATAAI